jgi:cell shape-determining protein MreD
MEASTVQTIKQMLVSATSLSKDTLRIYVGLAVMFTTAPVSRRPLRSFLPWLIALAVAIAGELLDLHDDMIYLGHWRWQMSLHDLANTLFWPSVMLLLSRFCIILDRPV